MNFTKCGRKLDMDIGRASLWLLVLFQTLLGCSGRAGEERTAGWAKDLVSKEQHDAAAKYGIPVAFENSIGMRFVLIPPGEFMMGSNDGEEEERPAHRVRITKPFYMGVTEVTQDQYKAMMGKNPSMFRLPDRPDRPVEQVSWYDATEFCRRLTEKCGSRPPSLPSSAVGQPQGVAPAYRLPTEAEWEYACRQVRPENTALVRMRTS